MFSQSFLLGYFCDYLVIVWLSLTPDRFFLNQHVQHHFLIAAFDRSSSELVTIGNTLFFKPPKKNKNRGKLNCNRGDAWSQVRFHRDMKGKGFRRKEVLKGRRFPIRATFRQLFCFMDRLKTPPNFLLHLVTRSF